MAENRSPSKIPNAELKAGVFLTFCLALFIGMLFVLGKFGHSLRGRQAITVAFAQVNALHPEAPVYYNGMDIGHVKSLTIARADRELLGRIQKISRHDLTNLPLTAEERDKLGSTADDDLDSAVRGLLMNRTLVLLELDLLSEHDSQRFRVDDEYRISGSMMGDSTVEIRTGVGKPISPSYSGVFIGIGGDMYSDLGNSLAQVKDILASMAEMVGGDANKRSIQAQLMNFDGFTSNLEGVTSGLLERLPQTWDATNARVDSTQASLNEIEEKVKGIKPKIEDALTRAENAIAEARKSALQSLKEADDGIQAYRKDAVAGTHDLGKLVAQYKDSIPDQIHDARDWSDRFMPTVAKIDNFCSRADDQLDKGIESLRATLRGYMAGAIEVQHTLYNLKTWPWLLSHPPDTEDKQLYFDSVWQREMARQSYRELREELGRARASLTSSNAADQSRLTQIDEILRESDAQFPPLAPENGALPPTSGRKK